MSATAKLTTTAKFIRDGHAQACSAWKEKLEAKFPGVFAKTRSPLSRVKIGDRVTGDALDGHEYMIAATAQNRVALIGLITGNRWTNPVSVSSVLDISREELAAMLESRSGRVDSLIVNGKPYSTSSEYTMLSSHKVTVTEAFIKEAHEAANADWQKLLKLQFPTVFAPKTKYARLIGDDRRLTLSTGMRSIDGVDMIIGCGIAPAGKSDSCIMIPKDTCAGVEVTQHGGYWVVAFVKK